MPDNDAPPTDAVPQPSVSTPYLVTQPEGSTTTMVMHTDRQPAIGEGVAYAPSQGQALAGFPPPPPPPTTTTTLPPGPEPLVGPPQYVPPEVRRMQAPGVEGEWAAERTRTAPAAPAPVVLPAPR